MTTASFTTDGERLVATEDVDGFVTLFALDDVGINDAREQSLRKITRKDWRAIQDHLGIPPERRYRLLLVSVYPQEEP